MTNLQLPPDADPRIVRALRIHGALDLAFAALYAWVGFHLAPSRSSLFTGLLAAIVALLAAAGVTLLARLRVGRRIALVAHGALLIGCCVCVALLVLSASYLGGIYGSVGEGLATLTLVVAALVVQLCGLLPFFQLRLLLREEVALLHTRG